MRTQATKLHPAITTSDLQDFLAISGVGHLLQHLFRVFFALYWGEHRRVLGVKSLTVGSCAINKLAHFLPVFAKLVNAQTKLLNLCKKK